MIQLTFQQKENIGFQYILDSMHPCSPYGQERLRDLVPFGPEDRPELERQLYNLQRAVETEPSKTLSRLQRAMMNLKMIRPTVLKCMDTTLNEIELFEMKRFLLGDLEIRTQYDLLAHTFRFRGIDFVDTTPALDLLDPEGHRVATFAIEDGATETLRQLRKEKRQLEEQLRRSPEGAEKEECKTRRSHVVALEEQEEQLVRNRLSQGLRPYLNGLLSNMDCIADLDLTLEKARLAKKYGGTLPLLTEGPLELVQMKNPRIADLLESQGKTFTPITMSLTPGATVITGANMGGKSVALKTLALNILLLHCGFFPFAGSAQMPLFCQMHIISEDLESIDRGLSSFGGEMVRFDRMTQQLEEGFSFVLLDEFARGTNPQEGAALVRSVTRYLNGKNAISVLATHFDGVAPCANAHYQVMGLKTLDLEALSRELVHLTPEEGVARITAHMNYGLYRVDAQTDPPRDALNICRLLGMPREILESAEQQLSATGSQ